MGESDRLTTAYWAVSEAAELARNVQGNPERFGLDQVNGVVMAVLLRRVARDLEREADARERA